MVARRRSLHALGAHKGRPYGLFAGAIVQSRALGAHKGRPYGLFAGAIVQSRAAGAHKGRPYGLFAGAIVQSRALGAHKGRPHRLPAAPRPRLYAAQYVPERVGNGRRRDCRAYPNLLYEP